MSLRKQFEESYCLAHKAFNLKTDSIPEYAYTLWLEALAKTQAGELNDIALLFDEDAGFDGVTVGFCEMEEAVSGWKQLSTDFTTQAQELETLNRRVGDAYTATVEGFTITMDEPHVGCNSPIKVALVELEPCEDSK